MFGHPFTHAGSPDENYIRGPLPFAQLVYYTPQSPVRELYGTPVYGSLAVNKQIGRFLNLGVEWHDMFDSFCTAAKVNRHAANIKVQFRF